MSLLHITLVSLIHLVIAIKNPHEKCEFKDTVDLTNHTRYENGSFLYHNILIPEEKLAYYDYRLEFLNKSQEVDFHLRGCVCDAQTRRYCVKLCCDRDHFFNSKTKRCEKLPENRKAPTDLKIRVKDGHRHRHRNVNVFDHFVHQVGLPCVSPEVLSIEQDIWDLLENGSLYIYGDNALLDTVSYCITPHHLNGSGTDILMPMSCPMRNELTVTILLNTYAMAASVIFLIPTILVYVLIKELRSNLGGKLLICYLFSMASAYTVISYINISQQKLEFTICSILGFGGYFLFVSVFMWLSVLCFDIWSNFNEVNVDFNVQYNKTRFAIYSIYAWGSAGLLTSFVVWAQISDDVPELYKPGIGFENCWLDTRKWAAALYFYWPNFIILVFNIITFITMTVRIYRVRSDVAKMTNRDSFLQENAAVLLRLFFIMGISWIMDTISYCLRNYKQYDFFFILTDLCNAIQGVLIFILFILKPKVIALIKAKFQPPKPHRPRLDATSRETNFSRLTSSTAATGSTTIAVSP